jgi:hypothetical protein
MVLVEVGQLVNVDKPGRPDPVEVGQIEPLYGHVIRHFDFDYAIAIARLRGEAPPPFRGVVRPFGEPFPLERWRPGSECARRSDVSPLLWCDCTIQFESRTL